MASLSPRAEELAASEHFTDVYEMVLGRCSMCHAQEPYWEGIVTPPKNIILETEAQVATYAEQIYLQAGRTWAMPPSNVSFIEPSERALIVAWFEGTGLAAE